MLLTKTLLLCRGRYQKVPGCFRIVTFHFLLAVMLTGATAFPFSWWQITSTRNWKKKWEKGLPLQSAHTHFDMCTFNRNREITGCSDLPPQPTRTSEIDGEWVFISYLFCIRSLKYWNCRYGGWYVICIMALFSINMSFIHNELLPVPFRVFGSQHTCDWIPRSSISSYPLARCFLSLSSCFLFPSVSLFRFCIGLNSNTHVVTCNLFVLLNAPYFWLILSILAKWGIIAMSFTS